MGIHEDVNSDIVNSGLSKTTMYIETWAAIYEDYLRLKRTNLYLEYEKLKAEAIAYRSALEKITDNSVVDNLPTAVYVAGLTLEAADKARTSGPNSDVSKLDSTPKYSEGTGNGTDSN